MTYEADYVVVGAGAAGSVVAARLAEDGTRSVIVSRPGPTTPRIRRRHREPSVSRSFSTCRRRWAPTHHPVIGDLFRKQNGKDYCYPRGTGLGGSTNHHAAVDGRGTPLDLRRSGRGRPATSAGRTSDCCPSSRRWRTSTCRTSMNRCTARPAGCTSSAPSWKGASIPTCCMSRCRSTGCHSGTISTTTRGTLPGIGWCDMQVHDDGRRSNAAADLLLPTLEKTKATGLEQPPDPDRQTGGAACSSTGTGPSALRSLDAAARVQGGRGPPSPSRRTAKTDNDHREKGSHPVRRRDQHALSS